MTDRARWYTVKCLPNLRRREPKNIGVLLMARDTWAARYVAQDVTTGKINGKKIPGNLQLSAEALRSWVSYFDRKAASGEWDDVLRLQAHRPRRVYVEPGGVILQRIDDLQATLDNLFDEIVGDPLPKRNGDRLEAEVDRILRKANISPIDRYVVPADYDGAPMDVVFDLGYQNGQLHLMDRAGAHRLSPRYAREAWARMTGAKRAGSASSFLVFYDSAEWRDAEQAEEALMILDRAALTLDVDNEDETIAELRERVAHPVD